jgi:GNAT superfamily N-acetyltransferase
MPEIHIRPAISTDIPKLINLDHHYTTDYVWQMTLESQELETSVLFREVRLPRSVEVRYPRDPETLADTWTARDVVLVAENSQGPLGYISLEEGITPWGTWVRDLVVDRMIRQKGIGSALLLSAQEWCETRHIHRLTLEMQPKNYPAIQFAYKLGFDFCGYNDQYYHNQDIALFFSLYF